MPLPSVALVVYSCIFLSRWTETLATLGIDFGRPSDGEAEQKAVEYAFKALDALGVKFGPTHTGEEVATTMYLLLGSRADIKYNSFPTWLFSPWTHLVSVLRVRTGNMG